MAGACQPKIEYSYCSPIIITVAIRQSSTTRLSWPVNTVIAQIGKLSLVPQFTYAASMAYAAKHATSKVLGYGVLSLRFHWSEVMR